MKKAGALHFVGGDVAAEREIGGDEVRWKEVRGSGGYCMTEMMIDGEGGGGPRLRAVRGASG